MRLTIIVTIDAVKDLSLLNVLIHSLNLQSVRAFDVVFYNQTLLDEAEILAKLQIAPSFSYRFFSIPREHFFGSYPIWDLYDFHNHLFDIGAIHDYVMSLHMEEFFDIDYVERVLDLLRERNFDILFGNLTRTRLDFEAIRPILETRDAADFERHLADLGIVTAHHWTFPYKSPFASGMPSLVKQLQKLSHFGFRRRLRPNARGHTRLRWKYEDLFLMKKEFALRYNWFLRGHRMYFEDIHICDRGDRPLSRELQRLTDHPIYFNRRRIYHLEHEKYYFQLLDEDFTSGLLDYETDDPILQTHKEAIRLLRTGELDLQRALLYTRRNELGTGTQNFNYRNHMLYLPKRLDDRL